MTTFDVSYETVTFFDINGDLDPITETTLGENAYLLFFDTGMDADYNDLVVLAEVPHPIPEPASMLLLSLGGLALLRKKRS